MNSESSPAEAAAAATTTVTTTAQQDGVEDTTLAGQKLRSSSSLESAATTATAPGAASSNARVTVLLPLGNLAVVELEGGSGCGSVGRTPSAFTADDGTGVRGCAVSGGDGDDAGVSAAGESSETERRLLRLEERVEILHCRGELGDWGACMYVTG